MLGPNHVAGGQDHSAGDAVLELPHVAGPLVLQENMLGFIGECGLRMVQLLARLANEVARKQSEIGEPHIHWPLVAIYQGELVGYLVAWYILDEAHVANICVTPAYRRCALGTLLMESALTEGRRRGTKRFDLEVRVSNATARKLYESLGFEPLGVRKRYYADNKEDALLMCLRLDTELFPTVDGGEADCPG